MTLRAKGTVFAHRIESVSIKRQSLKTATVVLKLDDGSERSTTLGNRFVDTGSVFVEAGDYWVNVPYYYAGEWHDSWRIMEKDDLFSRYDQVA